MSRYVARLSPAFHNSLFSDLRAAQAAVRGENASCEKTAEKYSYWMFFCTKMQMDHMLEDPEDPVIEIIQVFGHRVRH